MGENNKVLKVTYGNFSCRLEGFDDSVETLKTVVAYFHDLAGPTMFDDGTTVVPDLETLERVVTQDGGGDVDVTHDEDGIDLRVQSHETHEADDEVATAEDADDVADAEFDTADLDDDVAVQADEDSADGAVVDEEVATDDAEEGVDLADISAANDAEDITETDDTLEDDVAELQDDDIAEAEEADAIELDAEETAEVEDGLELDASDGDISEDEDHADIAAATDADETDATAETDLEEYEDTVDDSTYQLSPEEQVDTTNDKGDETAPLVLSSNDEDTASDVPVEDSPESVADKLQRIRAVVGRGTTPEDDTFAEDLGESEPVVAAPKAANPLAQRLAELAKRNSEMLDIDAQNAAPEQDTVTPFQLGKDARVDASEDQTTKNASEVISFSNGDDAEETSADADVPATDASEAKSTPLVLTDMSEAPQSQDDQDDDENFDLQEEVAKIERELAARPGNELARHGLPRSVEDAMSRILTQTDVELDLQETRDGRDAFAQLKAAVAATEAARQLGDRGPKTREVTRMFRDELDAIEGEDDNGAASSLKVVDTTTSGKSTLREVAPLTEAASRLREIAQMSESNGQDEDETFASFIANQDVSDLSDKLEAAAAFLSFVENEADFSRPQLMRVVQSEANEEISREDGLRSFGRLLRQSRIVKLPNGRFQVAKNTRFRPTNGHAAQG